MEKKVLLIALVLLLIVSLVACAAPAPVPAPTPAPSPAPAPTQPEKVITTWNAGIWVPSGDLLYGSLTRVCQHIELLSEGRLVLKPNPGGAIVPASKEFDGVVGRSLDYTYGATAYILDRMPTGGLFDSIVGGPGPFAYYEWYMAGEGGALLDEALADYPVVNILPPVLRTPETFAHSNKPMETLQDLKGLKMRASGDAGNVLSELGMAIIMLPGGEVYEAVQRGVIDAFEYGNPAVDWSVGFAEVADYVYLSNVRSPSGGFPFVWANMDSWEELADDLKSVVLEVQMAEGTRFRSELVAADLEAIQMFKDYGSIVQPLSKEIEDEIIRVSKEFYAEMCAKDPFFARVYNSLTKFDEDTVSLR